MTIHKAQGADGTQYKFESPTPDKNGKIKGLMYEKQDKKTGEIKQKSASGTLGHLWMKMRGYSMQRESTARAFILAKVPDADVPCNLNIHKWQNPFLGRTKVIPADAFQATVKSYVDNAEFRAALKK